MADPLVGTEAIEARLGRGLTGSEDGKVAAFITDVSGEVYSLVGEDAFQDEDDELDVPDVVVAVVCDAVIRRLENPRGLTGETIGDYNWQRNNGRAGNALLYLTAAEARAVRRAAGLPGIGTIQLQGDLPVGGVFDINTLTWS